MHMPEILHNPTLIMEDRKLLPGQTYGRQQGIPDAMEKLRDDPDDPIEQQVDTLFIQGDDPDTFDKHGRIQRFRRHGEEEYVSAVIEDTESYAWRIRDKVWDGGDPSALRHGNGHNTERARTEQAVRTGLDPVLRKYGLERYAIETRLASDLAGWEPGEFVFIKPNKISDISDPEKSPGTRAQLIRSDEIDQKLINPFAEEAVLQRPEKLIHVAELLDQLGIPVEKLELDPEADYLHAFRFFTLGRKAAAVELRLTDPRSDIGKQFATKLQLIEPQLVDEKLPELARAHALIRDAFMTEYTDSNYFGFDLIVTADGSIKIVNALTRALTPNLLGQAKEVEDLAKATLNVEARVLARTAIALTRR